MINHQFPFCDMATVFAMVYLRFRYTDMEVSWVMGGSPTSFISIGFSLINGGFLSHGGSPQSSIYRCIFHYKPSSSNGDPPLEPPHFSAQDESFGHRKRRSIDRRPQEADSDFAVM